MVLTTVLSYFLLHIYAPQLKITQPPHFTHYRDSSVRWFFAQSTYIYSAPQCMSPRWNWDSPTPLAASECALPPGPKGGGGTLACG